MEANELRIGNLVNSIGYDFYEDHIFADGTYDEHLVDIETLMFLEGKNPGYTSTGFKPINITEEWLVRLGFKDTGVAFEIETQKCLTMFSYQSEKAFYVGIKDLVLELEYIHQLQNLYFALTGEELTIK